MIMGSLSLKKEYKMKDKRNLIRLKKEPKLQCN